MTSSTMRPRVTTVASQRPNLVNALIALGNAYARVDRLNESNAAKARVEQLMQQ